jgi:hypothetical protein
MDTAERTLTALLSDAIRKRPPSADLLQLPIEEWHSLFKLAYKHQVHTLIYGSVSELIQNEDSLQPVLKIWRCSSLSLLMQQKQRLEILPEVIRTFEEQGVEYMMLKGLVLSTVYPHPNLRLMSDIDLLVRAKDIPKAIAVLNSKGYFEDVQNVIDRHLQFRRKGSTKIELHQFLIEEDLIQNAAVFEEKIWDFPQSVALPQDFNCLTLNDRNTLIYMIIHMVLHIKDAGFGIRQLCDLILFIEQKPVDLFAAEKELQTYGLDIFFKTLIACGHHFFALNLGTCESLIADVPPALPEELMQYIVAGGIYGKDNADWQRTRLYSEFFPSRITGSGAQKLLDFKRLMFPRISDLTHKPRYRYLEKQPYLLPYAWMYRFIRLIRRKDFSNENKYLFAFSGKQPAYKKDELLLQLKLL